MPDPVKKATEIKQRYEPKWLAIPGVTAVGVGQIGEDRIGIIISVANNTDKIRKQLPADVEGVPVEVRVSGEFKPF